MKSILKTTIPWPFFYQGIREDGNKYHQHNRCKKCSTRDCVNISDKEFKYYECSNGFSCIALSFMGDKVYLNGIIQSPTNNNFHGKQRKAYRNYIVSQNDVDCLQLLLLGIEKFTSEIASKRVRDSLSFVHDIRTSVGIVLSWCQAIIDQQSGANFEEKLEYASVEMSNLFHSINLLQEQISLAEVIANPVAITYGQKYRSKIHGFLYKHVKLFQERAEHNGCRIIMKGPHIEAEIESHNSFQLIPLILLDNAVKYSWRNREIVVQLEEIGTEVLLTVSSYGRIVPVEFREKIFDKYVRGPNVEQKHPQGMGLGLYIARLIAKAHNASVSYQCHSEDGDCGTNEFIIKIQKVTQPKK